MLPRPLVIIVVHVSLVTVLFTAVNTLNRIKEVPVQNSDAHAYCSCWVWFIK